jgi:predicted O-methyltransferase YrrM
MALSTTLKQLANDLLKRINVRIDSCTAERAEMARLAGLVAKQHFERPIFPVLPQFEQCDVSRILQTVIDQRSQFAKLVGKDDGVGFSLRNEYYASPDAEILYAMVHLYRPARIIEIGSGNSTRLFRVAIRDAQLTTRLTSIDPHPRCEVKDFADEILELRVEESDNFTLFEQLEANDILFVDSSHDVKIGNDVLFLLLNVIPRLRRGVLIHLHDIFLPFEYPKDWVIAYRLDWNEQYLLQALLQGSEALKVVWPGHYLQRTMQQFGKHFELCDGRTACSIWLQQGI